jgi:hypothetical protein
MFRLPGILRRLNSRKLEMGVDALSAKEAELKEKRRCLQSLPSGKQHDFSKDKMGGRTHKATDLPARTLFVRCGQAQQLDH